MTVQTINIDNTGDGFDYTGTSQTFMIMSGVAVVSETARGVATSLNKDKLINYGTLVGSTFAIFDNFDDAPDSNFSGDSTYINETSGLITADTAIKIETEGDTVTNYGHIEGGSFGIDALLDAVSTTISNYGDIDADGVAVGVIDTASIFNSGTIEGGNVGIRDYGLGGSTTIVNSGLIASGASGTGDAILGNGFGGAIKITNTGTIDGNMNIADLGSATVINKGSIVGHVDLPIYVANSFDGRGGSVEGTITGGSGVDSIHLGNDGETVTGGGGQDQFWGGTGADTFIFSKTSSLDMPTVHGFNVANDTIELLHSAYGAIAVGADPVFTIGTAATSATDHLFYNPTSGVLHYDPDGSGSHVAYGIARLSPGLSLTASNFSVV